MTGGDGGSGPGPPRASQRPRNSNGADLGVLRHQPVSRVWLLVLLALCVAGMLASSRRRSRGVARAVGRTLSSSLSVFEKIGDVGGSAIDSVTGATTGLSTLFNSALARSKSKQKPIRKAESPSDCGDDLQCIIESETIHIAMTSCGTPNAVEDDIFGLLNLKSLIMARANSAARTRRYTFHIMTNADAGELLNTTSINYDVYRAVKADPLLDIRVYHLDQLDAAAAAFEQTSRGSSSSTTAAAAAGDAVAGTAAAPAGTQPIAVPHSVFKNCAASRLKLPFVLDPVLIPRIIYLDWDAVTTCDLSVLWSMFGSWNGSQYLGFAANDPTGHSEKDIYRDSDMPRHPVHGAISSGVMMLDVRKLYESDGELLQLYWRSVQAIVVQRVPDIVNNPAAVDYWVLTRAFPLGDQDILNVYLAQQPQSLWLIPPQFNWCLADLVPFATLQSSGFTRPLPCVIHFCGGRLFHDSMKQEGSPNDEWVKTLWNYYKAVPLLPPETPPGPWVPPESVAAAGGDGG